MPSPFKAEEYKNVKQYSYAYLTTGSDFKFDVMDSWFSTNTLGKGKIEALIVTICSVGASYSGNFGVYAEVELDGTSINEEYASGDQESLIALFDSMSSIVDPFSVTIPLNAYFNNGFGVNIWCDDALGSGALSIQVTAIVKTP